jgi:hypothetical protein
MTLAAGTARLGIFFARPAATTADTDDRWSWGMFPVLALVAAAGVVLVAFANMVGGADQSWGDVPFFVGLVLIVVPIGLRLLQVEPKGTERAALVLFLGLALYACKVVHDPLIAGGYDEYLHLRTAQDIVAQHGLFAQNSLLTVSPYYPGLELVTTAISQMSGIGVYEAGIIVLGGARLVFGLSLFFFFAMASGSSRVAGIAALIYMTNSRFLYFDSQFAYETLALPLAAAVLYLLARRGHSGPARWLGLTVIAGITLAAVVTTHHVTSMTLSLFLLAWAVIALIVKRRDRSRPGRFALLSTGLTIGWTVTVATATIGYLAPVLSASLGEVLKLIDGEMEGRELFVSRAGDIAPIWERLVGSASAGIILALLPLGLLIVWFRFRSTPLMLTLGLVALTFPLTLAARFIPVGAEAAARTPELIFIGIAPVVALALARLTYGGRFGQWQMAVAGGVLAVLAIGGVLVGMPPWARLPGPYMVSADRRSIDAASIEASAWSRAVLGMHNNFVADRVNRVLLATFGGQDVVVTYESGVPVRNLYLSPTIGDRERRIVTRGDVEYLLVDHRLTTGLPVVGHYFDRGEEVVVGIHDSPLDPALLDKFDDVPAISRVYDSGDIQIYDMRGLQTTE